VLGVFPKRCIGYTGHGVRHSAASALHHVQFIGSLVVSDDIPPPSDKEARRKSIIIAVILIGISVFMYVSFIIKTAVKGP
jgi:hypothetical protein